MTFKLQIIIGIVLFVAGFLFCTMLGLTKAESYKIQIQQLGLSLQVMNGGHH